MSKRVVASRPTGKRGTSLLEMMVVLSLFSVITTVLVLFYRVANVEFEMAATNMSLSQYARLLGDKILPYASTAVPKGTTAALFIYSPTNTFDANQNHCPNIYNLDFSTACDFLARTGSSFDTIVDDSLPSTERYASMANIRGTGQFYRYRIRYDVPTLKLWLERVIDNAPAITTAALPGMFSSVSTPPRAPKLLGSEINSVEFTRVDNSITVRISMRALLRQKNPDGTATNPGTRSRWFQGQVQRNLQGSSKDGSGNASTKVTEIVTYTTVLLPVYSGK
jgi:prepilin-type N-terminal cleavage/methylation domain-containing protein